ncbi:MAG TPA: hypothetical protein PKJ19_10075, partial [Flavobacteriales bacterium]|nr:hypothetical protein [Flavobacteriales bacterium]
FNEMQRSTAQAVQVSAGTDIPSPSPAGVDHPSIKVDVPTYWKLVGIVLILILFVTMVYGPIAAFLVELFPTRIRYTSMSLPYHIGNGVFGGLTPFIATLLTTMRQGDALVGLWYPIGIAALCFIIGAVYINERTGNIA